MNALGQLEMSLELIMDVIHDEDLPMIVENDLVRAYNALLEACKGLDNLANS